MNRLTARAMLAPINPIHCVTAILWQQGPGISSYWFFTASDAPDRFTGSHTKGNNPEQVSSYFKLLPLSLYSIKPLEEVRVSHYEVILNCNFLKTALNE